MISDRLTIYPHAAVAGDHDNRQPDKTAIGASPASSFGTGFAKADIAHRQAIWMSRCNTGSG